MAFKVLAWGILAPLRLSLVNFLQLLHDGHDHWLTISSVEATPYQLLAYDSLYPSAGPATKMQIACLMKVKELNLTLTFADVQMQSGESGLWCFRPGICSSYLFWSFTREFPLRSVTYEESFKVKTSDYFTSLHLPYA